MNDLVSHWEALGFVVPTLRLLIGNYYQKPRYFFYIQTFWYFINRNKQKRCSQTPVGPFLLRSILVQTIGVLFPSGNLETFWFSQYFADFAESYKIQLSAQCQNSRDIIIETPQYVFGNNFNPLPQKSFPIIF